MPTQQRALDTVQAAISATITLLERHPEEHVTLEAIRLRAGVSQGSLTHHFGDRAGLIAAAHVERYARACEADAVFLGRFDGAIGTPLRFADAMLDMANGMISSERQRTRWIRLAAIGAAFDDEALTRTLSSAYTALTDRLAGLVLQARANGVLHDECDARTVALLSTMQSQGLVLDDLSGVPVEAGPWNHLHVRFVKLFLTDDAARAIEREAEDRYGPLLRAETFGRPGHVPRTVADRLRRLRGSDPELAVARMTDARQVRALLEVSLDPDADHRPVTVAQGDLRGTILTAAASRLRARGEAGVDAAELRSAVGLSPQAFHRLIGTRAELVREARIRLEVSRAANALAGFAQLIEGTEDPGTLRAAIAHAGSEMAGEDRRRAMWQRIQTLAASSTDPDLRTALGSVQRTMRDLLIEQVCIAQGLGLIDPTMPAVGVARLLDGTTFWHVFHELDGQRPAQESWGQMLERIAWLLCP